MQRYQQLKEENNRIEKVHNTCMYMYIYMCTYSLHVHVALIVIWTCVHVCVSCMAHTPHALPAGVHPVLGWGKYP